MQATDAQTYYYQCLQQQMTGNVTRITGDTMAGKRCSHNEVIIIMYLLMIKDVNANRSKGLHTP